MSLPDVMGMVLKYLRDNQGLPVDTKIRPNSTFPMLTARRIGGIPKERRHIDNPRINVKAYADDEITAMDAARAAHAALHQIANEKSELGVLCSARDTLGFTQLDDQTTDRSVVMFEVAIVAHS